MPLILRGAVLAAGVLVEDGRTPPIRVCPRQCFAPELGDHLPRDVGAADHHAAKIKGKKGSGQCRQCSLKVHSLLLA